MDYHISTCFRCGMKYRVDFDKGMKFMCPHCGEISEYIIPIDESNKPIQLQIQFE